MCAVSRLAVLHRVGIEGVAMDRSERLFDWASSVGRICLSLIVLLLSCTTFQGMTGVDSRTHADAVRLNNIGTALMSQQLLEKAIAKFEEAYKLDPSLTAAELNKGIALLYLQRLPEATTALQHAATQSPNDPRVWYVFGLLYRIDNKPRQSAEAFQRVLKLDPSNADSHYFLGSLLANQQDLAAAAAEFQAALRLEPLHASAEFGLARTLQHQGKVDEARAALARFQQLTSANLSFPISHTYGEEGSLGRAEDAATNAPKVEPMIPVTFSRAWQTPNDSAAFHNNNACLIDLDGDG